MKVLVVGPSWVGDMVMAQALFRELQRRDDSVIIDVLAPAWSEPILERMPEVRHSIEMPVGHGQAGLSVRYRIGKSLREENYDQAFVLPNSFKSALVPFWAGIQKRTGWRGEMRYGLLNDISRLDKQKYPLMVQRFVALASQDRQLPEQILYPRLQVKELSRNQAMEKFSITADRKILALCPGAEFGPSKQWPAASFARLAAGRIGEGWQVLVFGSANDAALAGEIHKQTIELGASADALSVLAGKTSLAEAVDLLSLGSLVVSNDSGLMHVAAALGRKLVAVYGSTSPDFTPPLGNDCHIVKSDLECSPCFQRECPLGHGNCMKEITVEQVEQVAGLEGVA